MAIYRAARAFHHAGTDYPRHETHDDFAALSEEQRQDWIDHGLIEEAPAEALSAPASVPAKAPSGAAAPAAAETAAA